MVGETAVYFYGVMSKVLMTLDVMSRHKDTHDWIMYTDEDVHINAGRV